MCFKHAQTCPGEYERPWNIPWRFHMEQKLSSFAFLAALQAHCGYAVTCNCSANKSSGMINGSTTPTRIHLWEFTFKFWLFWLSPYFSYIFFILMYNFQFVTMMHCLVICLLLVNKDFELGYWHKMSILSNWEMFIPFSFREN